jgi:hypothetical protein
MKWPTPSRQPAQLQPLSFWSKPLGLNLVENERLLLPDEHAALLNFKLNDFGKWVTRDGLKKVSSVATGAGIKHIAYIPIGANTYIFLVDEDYKIYKCTGSETTITPGAALATLAGDATLVPFNGYCVILDGSYIKVTQGTTVSLAYDDGAGLSAYQHSNLCADDDNTQDLYSGSKTRCGSKFTTDTFPGYTIPLTALDIWLSKTGSPTGNITAKLYNSAGSSLLATSTAISATTLTTSAIQKQFVFDGSYSMASATSFIVCVEYSGGDAANYVSVHGSTVASGGDQYYYDGSWHAVTTANTNLGVKPGLPPKASFGDVKDNRLFVAGDPDNPGYLWYSNVNTVFDWSTATSVLSTNTGYDTDGGGYVSSIDDNANSYPIGGIVVHYGEVFVFGEEQQPFISRLTGQTPNNYSLPSLSQQMFTNHKTIKSLRNDVWFASGESVHNMVGVQEYGDLRTYSPGDPVKNEIFTYFDDDAFAEYNPADGQYMIKLGGYDNILVCHTAYPVQMDQGPTRYPWSAYKFKDLTATAFRSFNNKFYVGCSNGYLYRLDDTIVEDDGTMPDYEMKSAYIEFPWSSIIVKDMFLAIASLWAGSYADEEGDYYGEDDDYYGDTPASWTVSFYRNGNTSVPFLTHEFSVSLLPIRYRSCFSCDSLQIKLDSLSLSNPVNIQGITLSVQPIRSRGY